MSSNSYVGPSVRSTDDYRVGNFRRMFLRSLGKRFDKGLFYGLLEEFGGDTALPTLDDVQAVYADVFGITSYESAVDSAMPLWRPSVSVYDDFSDNEESIKLRWDFFEYVRLFVASGPCYKSPDGFVLSFATAKDGDYQFLHDGLYGEGLPFAPRYESMTLDYHGAADYGFRFDRGDIVVSSSRGVKTAVAFPDGLPSESWLFVKKHYAPGVNVSDRSGWSYEFRRMRSRPLRRGLHSHKAKNSLGCVPVSVFLTEKSAIDFAGFYADTYDIRVHPFDRFVREHTPWELDNVSDSERLRSTRYHRSTKRWMSLSSVSASERETHPESSSDSHIPIFRDHDLYPLLFEFVSWPPVSLDKPPGLYQIGRAYRDLHASGALGDRPAWNKLGKADKSLIWALCRQFVMSLPDWSNVADYSTGWVVLFESRETSDSFAVTCNPSRHECWRSRRLVKNLGFLADGRAFEGGACAAHRLDSKPAGFVIAHVFHEKALADASVAKYHSAGWSSRVVPFERYRQDRASLIAP